MVTDNDLYKIDMVYVVMLLEVRAYDCCVVFLFIASFPQSVHLASKHKYLHDLMTNLYQMLHQGSHRLEKYLNIQDCLEKSLEIKFALKST